MNAANTVLDLADFAPAPGAPRRPPMARGLLWALGAALLAAVLSMAPWRELAERSGNPAASGQDVRNSLETARNVSEMTVDDRGQILAEGTDAQSRNAAIPFASGTAVPARAFLLSAPAAAAGNAHLCLTQAIYHEAANEPLAGRRAVAQVVLNRVRHPAYPDSVCGVVYQGAERRTGCQFSFTCDGALLRSPMARQWREAGQIAREALAGRVEPSVGTATHYHADYVLPRWAFTLAKVNQLGRHLFYRFDGAWGRPAAFTSRYSASETVPLLDADRLRARVAAEGLVPPAAEAFVPNLTVVAHASDRHAANDVGGRLDTTRAWRLNIPAPDESSANYRALISTDEPAPAMAPDPQAAPLDSALRVEARP